MPPAKPRSNPPLLLCPLMRSKPDPVAADTARQVDAIVPDLRRLARQLSASSAEADDLVQATLLQLWGGGEIQGKGISGQSLRDRAFASLKSRALSRAAAQTGGAKVA